MKKVIDNKVYNTETAELLFEVWYGYPENDMGFAEDEYYKTKKGNYFKYCHGGPASIYREYITNTTISGDDFIELCTYEDVLKAGISEGSQLSIDDYERMFGKLEEG